MLNWKEIKKKIYEAVTEKKKTAQRSKKKTGKKKGQSRSLVERGARSV